MKRKRSGYGFNIGLILLGVIASLARGSEPVVSTNLLGNEKALEAFVDQLVTNRMQEAHVPGAVVTIVSGDRVVFNKGYGFANLEQYTPVDPDKTLFRIASVSKVFNAMAVMRLVDEGVIDVNEDVRPRLAKAGLELDHEEYGPVTMKALLTHSAGIRDVSMPPPRHPGELLPLGIYLQRCLPLRWQEPGESVLYTDHGITLAGYVVELASKTNFEEAVVQRVMRPLRMYRTCYAVPEDQRANLAVAYSYENSGEQAVPFHYTNLDPAVGVLTTGSDMARLMICHLSNCKGFLKPETVKLMHEPQYADDARLGVQWTCGFFYLGKEPHSFHPGGGYGFQSAYLGKEPYLYHEGGAYGFQCSLGVSLRHGIAVFSAQNAEGSVFGLGDLLDEFSRREVGTQSAKPAKASDTAAVNLADIQSVVGTYVLDRRLSRGIKLTNDNCVRVRYAKDIEGIEVDYPPPIEKLRLTEVAPFLFRSVTNDEQLSFRTTKDGKRTYLIDYHWDGSGAFRRISSSDDAGVP